MDEDLNDLYGDITAKSESQVTNEDAEYLQTLAQAKVNMPFKSYDANTNVTAAGASNVLLNKPGSLTQPSYELSQSLAADLSGRPRSIAGYLLQGPPPTFKNNSNVFIHVSNLVFWATDRSIENIFSLYGRVRQVLFLEDKTNGKSVGEALLQFEEDESAYTAVEKLNGAILEGQRISVCIATPEQQSAFVTHNKGKKERQQSGQNLNRRNSQNVNSGRGNWHASRGGRGRMNESAVNSNVNNQGGGGLHHEAPLPYSTSSDEQHRENAPPSSGSPSSHHFHESPGAHQVGAHGETRGNRYAHGAGDGRDKRGHDERDRNSGETNRKTLHSENRGRGELHGSGGGSFRGEIAQSHAEERGKYRGDHAGNGDSRRDHAKRDCIHEYDERERDRHHGGRRSERERGGHEKDIWDRERDRNHRDRAREDKERNERIHHKGSTGKKRSREGKRDEGNRSTRAKNQI